jgi:hypothetical protein
MLTQKRQATSNAERNLRCRLHSSIVAIIDPSPGTNVGKKYYFQRDPVLDNAFIYGMIIYPGDNTSLASNFPAQGGRNAPLTDAQLKQLTITLCDEKGNEIFSSLVPATFRPDLNNGICRTFMRSRIYTQRSFIQFQDSASTSNNSYLLIDFIVKDIR